MSPKHALVATAAAIVVLGVHLVQANDGQSEPEKKATGAQPSAAAAKELPADRAKEVLGKALEMVHAATAPKSGAAPPAGFPGQVMMVPAQPKDLQADAMRQIGRALAQLGDQAGARKAWQSALAAAPAIAYNPGGYSRICIAIARAQVEESQIDEAKFTLLQALQTARLVTGQVGMMMPGVMVSPFATNPVAKKVDLLRQIAQLQMEAGDVEGARDVLRQAVADARSLPKPLERIAALLKVAAADGKLADIGRSAWSCALDAAMAEKEKYPRARAVEMVLRARVQALQLDEALATIAGRLDGDLKDYAIWVVADAVAASDQPVSPPPLARLRELASKARYDRPAKKIKVYRRLAEAHARLGDYDQAYRCLGELEPANNVENFRTTQGRVYLMKAVAKTQLKAKEYEAAKDTVLAALEAIGPLPNGDAEAYFPLAELATIQAEAGDIPGALRTADSVSSSASRVRILGEIAAAYARQGRRDDARATIRRAFEAGRRAPDDALWSLDQTQSSLPNAPIGAVDPMLPVWLSLAQIQARADDLDGALQTVSNMGRSMWASYYREQAIGQVVSARLDAGDVPGARKAAETLPDPDGTAPVFIAGDDFDPDTVGAMPSGPKGGLLERIARRQAERGDPALVLEWARGREPATQLHMLRGLAEGLAQRLGPRAEAAKPARPSVRPQSKPAGP